MRLIDATRSLMTRQLSEHRTTPLVQLVSDARPVRARVEAGDADLARDGSASGRDDLALGGREHVGRIPVEALGGAGGGHASPTRLWRTSSRCVVARDERHGSLSLRRRRATVNHVDPCARLDRRGRRGASRFDGRFIERGGLRDGCRDQRSRGDRPTRNITSSVRRCRGPPDAGHRRPRATRIPSQRRCARIDPSRNLFCFTPSCAEGVSGVSQAARDGPTSRIRPRCLDTIATRRGR